MDAQTPFAAGIDLGGTGCKASIFGADWGVLETISAPTPRDYDSVLRLIKDQSDWVRGRAPECPLGICSAGRTTPQGVYVAANLPAHGKAFTKDLARVTGRDIGLLNDGEAFALSEAHLLGAEHQRVFGIVIGTGLGGGLVQDGVCPTGATGTLGEIGHMASPGSVLLRHGLDISLMEGILSGPGLSRLFAHVTGEKLDPEKVIAGLGSPNADKAWRIFCETLAELILTLIRTADPEVIVLGGGLGGLPRLAEDVAPLVGELQLPGFPVPDIRTARGGPESGARGAAIMAAGAL